MKKQTYFHSKTCQNCGCMYDELLANCPNCHEVNKDAEKKGDHYPHIPFSKEIWLFIIGLIVFSLLAIVFTLLFKNITTENEVKGMMLINVANYVCIFLCLLLVLFPFIKNIITYFTKGYEPYIWGIIGAVALFVFSILWGLISEKIMPSTPGSENQQAAYKIVKAYPAVGILILGIVGPITEEITYRMGLFTVLSRFRKWVAYVVTIIVFGLLHFSFQQEVFLSELLYLPQYLFAGFVFCFLYDKQGPAASFTAHILNNMISVILILAQ